MSHPRPASSKSMRETCLADNTAIIVPANICEDPLAGLISVEVFQLTTPPPHQPRLFLNSVVGDTQSTSRLCKSCINPRGSPGSLGSTEPLQISDKAAYCNSVKLTVACYCIIITIIIHSCQSWLSGRAGRHRRLRRFRPRARLGISRPRNSFLIPAV